jgi:hypothetical protein
MKRPCLVNKARPLIFFNFPLPLWEREKRERDYSKLIAVR